MKLKLFYLSALSLLSVSCGNVTQTYDESQFVGKWHEILPEEVLNFQGIELKEDGTASSIGKAALNLENWQLIDGDKILLSGKSIGKGQDLSIADTLKVLSLSNDTLILGKGDSYKIKYRRINLIGGSDAAMGYTYSRLLDKKIRIFEAGVRVLSTTNPNATSAGYVVFADDSSKVELFLPEHEQTTILNKAANDDGTVVWRMEGSDLMLEKSKGKWSVTKDDRLIYSSK